jgi:hypothetical protein
MRGVRVQAGTRAEPDCDYGRQASRSKVSTLARAPVAYVICRHTNTCVIRSLSSHEKKRLALLITISHASKRAIWFAHCAHYHHHTPTHPSTLSPTTTTNVTTTITTTTTTTTTCVAQHWRDIRAAHRAVVGEADAVAPGQEGKTEGQGQGKGKGCRGRG